MGVSPSWYLHSPRQNSQKKYMLIFFCHVDILSIRGALGVCSSYFEWHGLWQWLTNCDWWVHWESCCMACKYSFTWTNHIYAFTYCLCPDLMNLMDSNTKNIYSKVLFFKVCQPCSRGKQHEGIRILNFLSQPEHNSFYYLIFFLYLDHIFPLSNLCQILTTFLPINFKRKPKKSKNKQQQNNKKKWHKNHADYFVLGNYFWTWVWHTQNYSQEHNF